MYQFLFVLVSALAIILALLLAFSRTGPQVTITQEPQSADASETPPLGDKAGSTLLTVFQDFYRQEVAAEEDVHRSLPFFATALGLVITALNVVATQLPSWTTVLDACAADDEILSWRVLACAWPAGMASILLFVSALSIVGVLWYLSRAATPRDYDRAGPERDYINRANEFRSYHESMGLTGDPLDLAVNLDLRNQVIQDLARILPHNRELSRQRYNYRARAFRYLLVSLLLALVATIIILITAKAGLLPTKGLYND